VGTVDSFQGQERDLIAITLTRSNPQGEIGFLSDIRRMNLGMTRARRQLLLVGDSSTLCSHPFFVELLVYVKGLGGTAQGMKWADRLESVMDVPERMA
jgi:superfamily I DNA and/or RNA helicase